MAMLQSSAVGTSRSAGLGWTGAAAVFGVFAATALVHMQSGLQFMWLKVGLFVYTEAAGPVLLCFRDDAGRPAIIAKQAAVFTLLRIAGAPKPAYGVWPFPTVKVYESDGNLERAGKTGPFHR